MNKKQSLVVIGGGAAGFFCAIQAAEQTPLLNIIILEKSNKVLSKVKVSGGGRCNVTHDCLDIIELSKKYPRGEKFLKKAFHWFNVNHTIEWFKNKNILLKKEDDGRMFPISNTSQTIIDSFLELVYKLNIDVKLQVEVQNINTVYDELIITLTNGSKINANYICVAAGGYPKIHQFHWLQELGHRIKPPVPSLFTFNLPKNQISTLMGISVPEVIIKISGTKFQQSGPLLITHWGFSGPAVLKLSAFAAIHLADCNYQFSIQINWLNKSFEVVKSLFDELRRLKPKQKIINANSFNLPARLWQYFLELSLINEDKIWAELTSKQENCLITLLIHQQFDVSGKTTFKEEFVTCGGVDLSEVDVNTMQSKKVNNLFFAGEVLDIDGITGGFNFQAAWTTAYIAAKTIAQKSKELKTDY